MLALPRADPCLGSKAQIVQPLRGLRFAVLDCSSALLACSGCPIVSRRTRSAHGHVEIMRDPDSLNARHFQPLGWRGEVGTKLLRAKNAA